MCFYQLNLWSQTQNPNFIFWEYASFLSQWEFVIPSELVFYLNTDEIILDS